MFQQLCNTPAHEIILASNIVLLTFPISHRPLSYLDTHKHTVTQPMGAQGSPHPAQELVLWHEGQYIANPLSQLHPGAHPPDDLRVIMLSSLSLPRTMDQKIAFHRILRRIQNDGHKFHPSTTELEDVMRDFETVFFNGTLTQRPGNLVMLETGFQVSIELGSTQEFRMLPVRTWRAMIRINTSLSAAQGGGPRSMVQIFIVLLHEMVHAFIIVYVKDEHRADQATVGVTGHGTVWVDIFKTMCAMVSEYATVSGCPGMEEFEFHRSGEHEVAKELEACKRKFLAYFTKERVDNMTEGEYRETMERYTLQERTWLHEIRASIRWDKFRAKHAKAERDEDFTPAEAQEGMLLCYLAESKWISTMMALVPGLGFN